MLPNQEGLEKAMEYLLSGGGSNKEAKKEPRELPEVYRRLWDGVQRKSKKSKELTRAIDGQRRLEWLKLLLSKNQLHFSASDERQREALKQLTLYDDLLYHQVQKSSKGTAAG